MTSRDLKPTTIEVKESATPEVLLQVSATLVLPSESPMELKKGEHPISMKVALRQGLPLSTQLSLIHDAMETLRRLERALVTGNTSDDGSKGPAVNA